MDYQRDEHRVHLIVYYLIWCLKRRKPVLTGKIARDGQALIAQKCAEHGWTVVQLAIQPDHVHLFVWVWPTTSAADVIKACKGLTAHEWRTRYPVLLKMPSLWTCSYFASTAGNVSQETMQRSIAAQKGL